MENEEKEVFTAEEIKEQAYEEIIKDVIEEIDSREENLKVYYPYFVINKKLSTELIQSMFYVDSTEETENNTITNSLNTTSNSISSTTTVKDDELKIELINGSGNTSKLEEAKTKLEEAGFTVKKTGKTSTISKTVITNKKNATDEQLKNIKQALSTGSISTNKQASSQVDVTIVIGEDFE